MGLEHSERRKAKRRELLLQLSKIALADAGVMEEVLGVAAMIGLCLFRFLRIGLFQLTGSIAQVGELIFGSFQPSRYGFGRHSGYRLHKSKLLGTDRPEFTNFVFQFCIQKAPGSKARL